IGDRTRFGLDEQATILINPSGRHLIDDTHLRRKLYQITITTLQDLADATAASESSMLMQVQCLPVHGDSYCRFYPADEFFKFSTRRMPRYVHQMGSIGYDFDPLLYQQIDDPADRLFVARNCAGGIDHAVPWRERHLGVLVFRDTRKRCARFTLAACTKRDDFVRGQIAIGVHGAKILDALKITSLPRNLHDPLHCPADDNNLAVGSACGVCDGPQARDVRCKCRNSDPTPGRLDEFRDCPRDTGFRW